MGAVEAEPTAAPDSKISQVDLTVSAIFRGHANPEHIVPPRMLALQTALDARTLTNLVKALKNRPDLRGNDTQIVAVMGDHPGQPFHQTKVHETGAVFDLGPIFHHLNVTLNPYAVRSGHEPADDTHPL